jgi:hypothetical protein
MGKALLTNSRLGSARACQRLHRIKYALGYRPKQEAETLRFGTLIHKGEEAWWRAAEGERLRDALAAMAAEESDPFDLMRAQVMLTGYDIRWGPAMEHYEVLGVETEFRTELRNPETGRPSQTWELGGKIDVLVRDLRDGLVYVVEHKSSAEDISQGSEYWRRLRMDGQVSVYFEGGRSLGYEIAGCIYDVLGKPGQKPLKATPLEDRKYTKTSPPRLYANQREADETPEEYRERVAEAVQADPERYFQRGMVARLETEMGEALFDVWQLGQQIREAELAGRAPRNPDACVRWGRTCEFFDVCTGVASLDDPSLFRKSERIHPELSEGPKEAAQQ